ncbi:MAG TPA: Hsp20/alpha crystallin family protein [Candidatus Binataceae bacterium]|nr:Hsp20/alpha crystallin family protein [Candidatus Binataceae bacterium]
MARSFTSPFDDFNQVFDELFDELLIGRWRAAARVSADQAIVMDCGNRYEIQISTATLDRQQNVEIAVDENRVTVRGANLGGGKTEHSITLTEPVDREGVAARWFDHVLFILLPKRKKRSLAARKRTET